MIHQRILTVAAYLTSVGCAVFGAPPGSTPDTIAIELAAGSVETFIVGTAEQAKPALLIGLHGYGMDASQIATLVDIQPSFDHVYLAPQGFHELDDGTRAWFPIELSDGEIIIDPAAIETFLDRFEAYVDAALEVTGADPERVAIIGYSQGGAGAITLAATRPNVARVFVGLAGSVLDDATLHALTYDDARDTPLFIGHGTLDVLVDLDTMRTDVDRLRQRGLDLTYREYAVPHVVSAAQRRDVTAWLEDRF